MKTNPKSHTPTTQRGSKERVGYYTAWQHVYTTAEYADYGGLFMMRHRANSMMASDSTSTANSEHAWFVDSGGSHHMTSHQDGFATYERRIDPAT